MRFRMGFPRRRRVRLALLGAGVSLAFLLAVELSLRMVEAQRNRIQLPAKAAGAFRVVALGGSTVQGQPLVEVGFVAQLADGLRRLQTSRPIDVINLGHYGRASNYVVEVLRKVIDQKPDLVVVLSAHNELLDRPGRHSGAVAFLQRFALTRALLSLKRGPARRHDVFFTIPTPITPYDHDAPWIGDRLKRYRANLEEIARIAASRGVPLLLLTAPSNLADWPPAHRALLRPKVDLGYEDNVTCLTDLIAMGDLVVAGLEVDHQIAVHGRDPMFLFLKGRILREAGSVPQARDLFLEARDRDPFPYRVLSATNDSIRALGGRPAPQVVDIERHFESLTGDGLVGFDLMADNCHPNPVGHSVIAMALVEEIRRAGWLKLTEDPVSNAEVFFRRFVGSLGGREQRDRIEVDWRLGTAGYSMKAPFYHFAISRRYLETARELAPDDWRVWANMGTISILEDRPEGRTELSRARELKSSPLDPDDRVTHPFLKEATRRIGNGS